MYSDGEEVKLEIVLAGYKGNDEIVSRRALTNLVSEQTLFIRMGLTGGCVSREDCTPSQSCVEGVCRAVTVDARELPDFTDDIVDTVTCQGRARYIDTETGSPLRTVGRCRRVPAGSMQRRHLLQATARANRCAHGHRR